MSAPVPRRCSAALSLMCFLLPAAAEDSEEKSNGPGGLRIAVVDLEAVFAAHPDTELATRELSRARDEARDEFKEKSNELKGILQRHQELIRGGKREEAAEQLKEANEVEKAIATLRTSGQRDLEKSFREAKERILADIREAVVEWNAEEKYGLVFDSSSASSNGLPQVLDAPGAEDVTDVLIAFVKRRFSEKQSQSR